MNVTVLLDYYVSLLPITAVRYLYKTPDYPLGLRVRTILYLLTESTVLSYGVALTSRMQKEKRGTGMRKVCAHIYMFFYSV